MRYSSIFVAFMALLLCLLSCGDAISEQHNSLPNQSTVPQSQKEKGKRPAQNDSIRVPKKKKRDMQSKEKKQKASDTLKPQIVVL